MIWNGGKGHRVGELETQWHPIYLSSVCIICRREYREFRQSSVSPPESRKEGLVRLRSHRSGPTITCLKGVSQSPISWPFQVSTSNTCTIPLNFQFSSRIQSSAVCGGRGDGKGFIKGFPSTRDRIVVFKTNHES